MSTQAQTTQNPHKHLGEWRIPSAVAGLLILFCVAGASWGIWRWMQKPVITGDAVAVDPPTRGAGRRAGLDQPPGRILKRDDSIRAITGNYTLVIAPPNRQITLYCGSGEQWLGKDQQLLFNMAQRWSRGSNSVRNMQFTDEQKQQMKLVLAEPTVPLSEADKTRLGGLIKAWEEAKDQAKAEAQRAVLLAVREVAKANIAAAKEAFAANMNKLNQLITPQQISQYRQLESARRNGNRPPTTNVTQGA